MPAYEYKSADGTVIEQYFRAGDAPEHLEIGGVAFARVYSCGGVVISRGSGVCHPGRDIPVSMSLPRASKAMMAEGRPESMGGTKVVKLKDKTYCLPNGDRIIDSESAAQRVAEPLGLKREK